MGTKFWAGAAAVAAILASVGAASAADLAVKAPIYKAPPPVALPDWAGFYLGVHGGYGWADTDYDSYYGGSSVKEKGGLVGGHAGYNWQYGSVVAGLEADASWADIKKSEDGFTGKTDTLASVRARLGYTILPNLLLYGTGGAGWGHIKSSVDGYGDFADKSEFGWVAGAGLEYKLWGNFIARAEYLHYDFGKETDFVWPVGNVGVSQSVDTVRGGISYKF